MTELHIKWYQFKFHLYVTLGGKKPGTASMLRHFRFHPIRITLPLSVNAEQTVFYWHLQGPEKLQFKTQTTGYQLLIFNIQHILYIYIHTYNDWINSLDIMFQKYVNKYINKIQYTIFFLCLMNSLNTTFMMHHKTLKYMYSPLPLLFHQ